MTVRKTVKYHLHKAHPEKMQFEVYDLKEYRERSGTKASEAHSHSYYQMIWFFNDGGHHVVDFNTFPVQKNMLLFISKDQIHAFDENLSTEGFLIHFNESFFMHTDVDIFLKYHLFKSTENPCYVLPEAELETATSYITLIRKELQQRNAFGTEAVIRFLLKSFLITLERKYRTGDSEKLEMNSVYERQYYQFKELLESHYREGYTVNEYAEILHISSKTLTTITKNMVGMTPAQLIKERVILEAKRLLRFTTFQIGEVAFALGFEDDSYFVKYFRRSVGVSPKSFRDT